MLSDYLQHKPTVESSRLIIRPMIASDAEDLREWTPNKDVYKYWGKNPGKYDLKPELMFEKPEKPSKSFHLGIEYKDDEKIIGDIYVYRIERDVKAKIAIRLHPKYWGKGIAAEAVVTLTDWCFCNTELKTIWTDVDVNNQASVKVMEKCGFKRISEVKNGKMVSTVCDYYIYSLSKESHIA